MTDSLGQLQVDAPVKHPGRYDDWGPGKTADQAARAAHWEEVTDLQSGSGYDWDIIEVWRRKSDGRLVYDQDAGCSCYGPWESSTLDDLIELDSYTSFRDYVNEWNKGYDECSATEVAGFLDEVRRALHA